MNRAVKRIVIADDDPVSRRLLEKLLVKWSYEVTVVCDGTAAWHVLEQANAPRLAILDWMMPGVEGVEICKRVRESTDKPYTYVILLTGRTDREDLLQALKSGADDYLSKPFDAQELQARLIVGERILDLQDGLIAAKEELRFRATHDSLTGLSNRGVALDAIEREHSRLLRGGSTFGVILADLDHFKHVNDTHGHLCGDAILQETARRLAGCTRRYDVVGRYGGEEFLVVVPETDESGTRSFAERIRAVLENDAFVTEWGKLRITASIGAVVSSPFVQPTVLVQLADEALYRAKKNGRNRCEFSITTAPLEPAVPRP
jgi:two-component system, cell cycle response regulator